jgi:capsular polysaccharide export protein
MLPTNRPYKVLVFRAKRHQKTIEKLMDRAASIDYYHALKLKWRGPTVDRQEIVLCTATKNKPGHNRFARWCRQQMTQYQYHWAHHILSQSATDILVVFNGTKGSPRIMAQTAKKMGITVLYIEGAMLPHRLTYDTQGIHYGSSLPKHIDFYLQWMAQQSDIAAEQWRTLKSELSARPACRRKDIAQQPASATLATQRYIFCALQEPGDSQVTIYGGWAGSVKSMIEKLHKAAESLPEGWHLRIKEHPSSQQRDSNQAWLQSLENERFILDNQTNTLELIEHAHAVLNINSSVGLQAFFFDKPVLVLGKASYGIPELVMIIDNQAQLEQHLANPDAMTIHPAARNAYMNYLAFAYYPNPKTIHQGEIRIDDIIARDQRHGDASEPIPD